MCEPIDGMMQQLWSRQSMCEGIFFFMFMDEQHNSNAGLFLSKVVVFLFVFT